MTRLLLLLVALFVLSPYAASAQEPVEGEAAAESPVTVITPELVEAHYAYELAKLQLQQYRHVTLPQQRRELDEQIRLTGREIQILRRRLRDYRPFLEVDEFSPVRTAADSHELALLDAQSRYRQLRDVRINQMRYTRRNYRLLRLEVLKAATHLAEVKRSLLAR
ncbi:MAG: hypothetical protein MI725_11425 [Pirellulales bacterium]|nr:hypothetical protein [Pirellulales bacterium]